MGPPCSREKTTLNNYAVCFESWVPRVESGRLVATIAGEGPLESDFSLCRCLGPHSLLTYDDQCLGPHSPLTYEDQCLGPAGSFIWVASQEQVLESERS